MATMDYSLNSPFTYTEGEYLKKNLGGPSAFGVKGDGVTDDTAAIQAWVNSTQASQTTSGIAGAILILPPGEFVISDTITFYRFSGTIKGAGLGNSPVYGPNKGSGTVIRWNGPADRAMFKFRDYRYVHVSDIRFEGKDSSKPTYGIESNWLTGDDVGTNASLVVERCHIGQWPWSSQGTNVGAMQGGIGFTGNNGNNDQYTLRDLIIVGCDVGIDLPNSQSIWGSMQNVLVSTAVTAGIRTSAAFTGVNLQFDLCGIDIIADSTATCTILGWFSERSTKQLSVPNLARVSVYGGRWTLSAPMTAGSNFIDHTYATAGSSIFLRELTIVNQGLAPHPKIKVRGDGGGAYGGTFTMISCDTSMVITDFDIVSITTNPLNVRIETDTLSVQKRFTSGTTLGATHNKPALAANATDLATAITLVNDLKTKLIARGEYS